MGSRATQQIADAWQTANTRKDLDPDAQRAVYSIEREVQGRYGIDVRELGADPAAVRAALSSETKRASGPSASARRPPVRRPTRRRSSPPAASRTPSSSRPNRRASRSTTAPSAAANWPRRWRAWPTRRPSRRGCSPTSTRRPRRSPHGQGAAGRRARVGAGARGRRVAPSADASTGFASTSGRPSAGAPLTAPDVRSRTTGTTTDIVHRQEHPGIPLDSNVLAYAGTSRAAAVARYSEEAKEQVRDAVDFVDLVGSRTPLRPTGAGRLEGCAASTRSAPRA